MFIEVADDDRARITQGMLSEARQVALRAGLSLQAVHLDAEAYRPGRAFVVAQ